MALRWCIFAVIIAFVACANVAPVRAQLHWSDGSKQHRVNTAMNYFTGYWKNVRHIECVRARSERAGLLLGPKVGGVTSTDAEGDDGCHSLSLSVPFFSYPRTLIPPGAAVSCQPRNNLG